MYLKILLYTEIKFFALVIKMGYFPLIYLVLL